MALPADQVKVNMDQASDDPKQARQDLADNVDKFNALKAVLGDGVELDVGDGLKDDGGGFLALDLAADSGLEISGAKVRVKAAGAVGGVKRAASDAGIELDIDSLPEAVGGIEAGVDKFVIFDNSAGKHATIKDTDLPGVFTGLVQMYIGLTAPSGWVLLKGGSIGSATSGATVRANADTENLFTLFWDSMADAQAPVSTGRGASAAADWAANKNITIPDLQGKMPVGTGGTAPAIHGDNGGAETVTLTQAQAPLQAHTHTFPFGIGGSGPNVIDSTQIENDTTPDATGTTGSTGGASATAHENMSPWVSLNFIIKL